MAIHIFMMLSYLEIMKDGLHRPKGNQSTYKKKVWYLHPLLFIYALFLVFFFLHKITKFHFSEKSITLVRLVLQRELIFTHFFFSLQWEWISHSLSWWMYSILYLLVQRLCIIFSLKEKNWMHLSEMDVWKSFRFVISREQAQKK